MHILFTCWCMSGSQCIVKHVDRTQNPLTKVIESVEDDIKGLEPLDVELWSFNVCVDWLDTNIWIKGIGCMSCYLGVWTD